MRYCLLRNTNYQPVQGTHYIKGTVAATGCFEHQPVTER
jgi:hypothetical protein